MQHLFDTRYDLRHGHMKRYANLVNLKEIKASFTRFILAYKRLGAVKFFSEVHLAEAQFVPERYEDRRQDARCGVVGKIPHSDTA